MKKALIIAGSDSSGGAGIQADIKTFSALGLYCTTVLSVLTAQNTKTVSDIFIVPPSFFKEQLISTISDINPDVIKIAVLYDNSIIDIVYDTLYPLKIPIVLDPVLFAGTGIKLLKDDSYNNFKKKIIPISFVITPNLKEAEILSGQKVSSEDELIKTIVEIRKLGVDNIIVKGVPDFNTKSEKIFDILLEKGSSDLIKIYNDRLNIAETHGTGCNFSSSLASFIGKGQDIKKAFYFANEYVKEGLINSIDIGHGIKVTNPLSVIYENSSRFKVIFALNKCISKLEEINDFYRLIPETKTNFVYALEDPQTLKDVAGIKGRITEIGPKIRMPNIVEFGASKHVANAVISANKINKSIRSAINIKKDDDILKICKENFKCSFYLRQEEKFEDKIKEGMTISWGIKRALEKDPKADIVFHEGDYGKEPMIIIFGKSPDEILDKIKTILSNTYFSN